MASPSRRDRSVAVTFTGAEPGATTVNVTCRPAITPLAPARRTRCPASSADSVHGPASAVAWRCNSTTRRSAASRSAVPERRPIGCARLKRASGVPRFGETGVMRAKARVPSAHTGTPMLRWASASYHASAAAAVAVSASSAAPSPSNHSRASSSGELTRLGTNVYASRIVVWLLSASTHSATMSSSPSRRVNVPSAGVP